MKNKKVKKKWKMKKNATPIFHERERETEKKIWYSSSTKRKIKYVTKESNE